MLTHNVDLFFILPPLSIADVFYGWLLAPSSAFGIKNRDSFKVFNFTWFSYFAFPVKSVEFQNRKKLHKKPL